MNDLDRFEADLKQRLNEAVDAELGPRRMPPPLHVQQRPQRIRPWLIPLAAAAAVVAVMVGTATAVHLNASRTPVTPATPSDSVSHTEPASPTPNATGNNEPLLLTRLGSLEVALPAGWVVRAWSQYLRPGETSGQGARWCLTPGSTPVTPGACPVALSEPAAGQDHLDSSFPGGLVSNPEFCGPGKTHGGAVYTDRAMFARRAADHVTLEEDCSDGRKFHQEQYLLLYAPTVIVYAQTVTPELSSGMSFIALHSRAPARTGQLPLYYQGSVTAVTSISGAHRVTIDGVRYQGQSVPGDPQPSSLTVDVDVDITGSGLAVGKDLSIYTDGSKVTSANVLN